MSEQRDRLLHVLLQGQLGDDRPPDVSARVLARAFPRKRPWLWAAVGAAAAAAIVLTAVGLILRNGYPQPGAEGGYAVAGGGPVGRGATLTTAERPARLDLGGYCAIELSAGTQLRIDGQPKSEAVYLQRGRLSCQVERSVGAFTVASDVGQVSVTGTKFTVELIEPTGDSGMSRQMLVKVAVGAVLVSGLFGQVAVAAGQEAAVPASGTVTGVVAEKGDLWIRVKAADGTSERYTPRWVAGEGGQGGAFDKEMVAAIAKLKVGDKIQLKWEMSERRRITELKLLEAASQPAAPAEGATGTTVGLVTARERELLAVKADGAAEGERFVPRMVTGPDGKPMLDQDILAVLDKVKRGDKVEVKWLVHESRKRITGLKVLESAPAETPAPAEREKPKPPAVTSGTVVGTVTEKGENWLRVKDEKGAAERYLTRSVEGGFDKDILNAIANVKAGQKVEIKWTFNEGRRIAELKVVE